jgi:hypothetical protein
MDAERLERPRTPEEEGTGDYRGAYRTTEQWLPPRTPRRFWVEQEPASPPWRPPRHPPS